MNNALKQFHEILSVIAYVLYGPDSHSEVRYMAHSQEARK
jgi:hypothetical protein